MTYVHVLAGCASRPLALYLKGLGVLRLIAEQTDAKALGCWRAEGFVLVTELDRTELLDFFLRTYVPTPLVAPWNGGSGFYPKDTKTKDTKTKDTKTKGTKTKGTKDGVDTIAASQTPRFAPYRDAIETARRLVSDLDAAPKDEPKVKAALIRDYAKAASRLGRDWLDAAIVLDGTGDPRYPSLFGTGGQRR